MFRLVHSLTALLAVSPLVAAQAIKDGTYIISYSALGCGSGTPHYLDLSKADPSTQATFKPVTESQAQKWKVTTSPSAPAEKRIESMTYADTRLGYPNMNPGTRIRAEDEEDFYTFSIVNTTTPDCHYVYPASSKDVGVNGDSEVRNKNRFAYLRGDIKLSTGAANVEVLPILPLKFTKVT